MWKGSGLGDCVLECKTHKKRDRLRQRHRQRRKRKRRAASQLLVPFDWPVEGCFCFLMAPVKCSAPSSRWLLPIGRLPRGPSRDKDHHSLHSFLLNTFHGWLFCRGKKQRGVSHKIFNQPIKVHKTTLNGPAIYGVLSVVLADIKKAREARRYKSEAFRAAHTDLHKLPEFTCLSFMMPSLRQRGGLGYSKLRKKEQLWKCSECVSPPAAWQHRSRWPCLWQSGYLASSVGLVVAMETCGAVTPPASSPSKLILLIFALCRAKNCIFSLVATQKTIYSPLLFVSFFLFCVSFCNSFFSLVCSLSLFFFLSL